MEIQIILGIVWTIAISITLWRIGKIKENSETIKRLLMKSHNDARNRLGLHSDPDELFDGSGGLRFNPTLGYREIWVETAGEWKKVNYNYITKKYELEKTD